MDGWTDEEGGWMDGWMDGLVDGWRDGWMEGWMIGWMRKVEGVHRITRIINSTSFLH